ncbi:MAG TPA: ribosome maturation factor RimM [Luteitalea sp.]|nr:ribosome maturation factor RimM [Luteitalea sp.]
MTALPATDADGAGRWEDMVLVGRLGRSHGLRGDVLLQSETDFPETRFAAGATVYGQRNEQVVALEIERFRMHGDRPLVAFVGFATIEAIEALGHGELRVPESALTPLPDGEHYWYRYVGTPVRTEGGEEVGTVLRVEPTGSTGVLVVGRGDEEVQIPLTPALCPVLGPELIVVRPPEGLLDLNTPGPGKGSANRHRDDLPRAGARRAPGRHRRPGGGRGRR